MEYQNLPEVTKSRFEAEMPNAGDREKAILLLGIHECSDWRWVQSVYLEWMQHQDHWIASAAITGLGHLARCAGQIEKNKVVPALEALAKTRLEMAGKVEDALGDIEMFAK